MADNNQPPDVSNFAPTKRSKAANGQSRPTSGVAVGYVQTTASRPLTGSTYATQGRLNGTANGKRPGTTSTRLIRQTKCIVCSSDAIFLCSKCCQVWYCRRECQKEHWASHQKVCSDEKRRQLAQSLNIPYGQVASNGSSRPAMTSAYTARPGMIRASTPSYSTRYGYPSQAPMYTMPSSYIPSSAVSTTRPLTSTMSPHPSTARPSNAPLTRSATSSQPGRASSTAPNPATMATSQSSSSHGTSTSSAAATTGTDSKQQRCALCGNVANCKCPYCEAALYCSEACQQKAWPAHSTVCKRNTQAAAAAAVGGTSVSSAPTSASKPAYSSSTSSATAPSTVSGHSSMHAAVNGTAMQSNMRTGMMQMQPGYYSQPAYARRMPAPYTRPMNGGYVASAPQSYATGSYATSSSGTMYTTKVPSTYPSSQSYQATPTASNTYTATTVSSTSGYSTRSSKSTPSQSGST